MAIFTSVNSAFNAGLEILNSIEQFNQRRDKAGQSPIHVGLSVNTGPVILGPVGDSSRMAGTVIGNTVNVASRMVSLTKMYGVKFVTSKTAIEKMVNKELKGEPISVVLRKLDSVKVVGKTTAVELHEIIPIGSPVVRIKDIYERGLQFYTDKNFTEALRCFVECVSLVPLDRPSSMFIDRCEKRMKDGVKEGWDGVETLQVK